MKRIACCLVVLFLVFTALAGLTGCSESPTITGYWVIDGEGEATHHCDVHPSYLDLFRDGSGKYGLQNMGAKTLNISISWTLENKRFVMVRSSGDSYSFDIEISGNKLLLKYSGGDNKWGNYLLCLETRTYSRTNEPSNPSSTSPNVW